MNHLLSERSGPRVHNVSSMDGTLHIPTIWEDQPVTGQDAALARAPEGMIAVARGLFQIDEEAAVKYLTSISNDLAADSGQVLHHADWVLASNVQEATAYGAAYGSHCRQCRAKVDQAVREVARGGGVHVFLGMLYYAGPDSEFQTLSG